MNIDPKTLQSEYQDLAGDIKIKVKIDKHQNCALHTIETDQCITFKFNPIKYRSPKKLERHMNECRVIASGGE